MLAGFWGLTCAAPQEQNPIELRVDHPYRIDYSKEIPILAACWKREVHLKCRFLTT